jgi:hypothetical protein
MMLVILLKNNIYIIRNLGIYFLVAFFRRVGMVDPFFGPFFGGGALP